MKIGDRDSFIKFEFKELFDLQGRHDVACRIKISGNGFAGAIDAVWFGHEDASAFIEKLETFAKIRKGAIELSNMSSGSDASPLEFKVFATDSLGHLAVRAALRKLVYFKDSCEISTVSVVFEIDPGALLSMIRDFKKLFMI